MLNNRDNWGENLGTEALIATVLEELAEAFHKVYLQDDSASSPASNIPWSDLDEGLREGNRESARAIPGQLDRMGLSIAPAVDGEGISRIDPALVESEARREHERWMDFKQSQGWVYGPVRNDDGEPPAHPDLVPWTSLSDSDRDKDRVRISVLPEVLHAVGLMIVPADQT